MNIPTRIVLKIIFQEKYQSNLFERSIAVFLKKRRLLLTMIFDNIDK